ncbi:MAG TPA: hypothetical protein VHO03_10550 [Ignavibacteriales bacterium]|nr:hypothetical protein [Ignavibacteriales bacterium]
MPELIKKILWKHPYLTVFMAALISWLPVVFIPFINDDYQILGYHAGKGWISLIRPFYTPDVSNFYWRPLGNVLHPLILLLTGFHPLGFRIVSLMLYGLCCVLIAKTGEKIGLSRSVSALGAVLFAVLPSHEYQVAWIADEGESLVTIMLLGAFYFYINSFSILRNAGKNLLAYFLLLFAAALVKESAFAGVLIPFSALLAYGDFSRKRIPSVIRDVFVSFALIVLILLYRWYFIGGTPFSSNHFAHSGLLRWLLNFFIYIPLGFFSPESLEIAAKGTPLMLLSAAALAAALALYFLFIHRRPVKLEKPEKYKLAAAFSWFVIFIIPGLPTLMRWYVFTASVGLIWSLSVIGENIRSIFTRKASFSILAVLILVSAVYDISLMTRWGSVGRDLNEALLSLNAEGRELKADSVYVWATPDKSRRIPMMKLGTQESVQRGLRNNKVTVISPLRSEMAGSDSRIDLVEKTDTSFVFHISDGRFLPYGGESRAVVKNESIETEAEGIKIRIKTFLDESLKPQSIAGVYFKKPSAVPQLYFDGREFKKARSK